MQSKRSFKIFIASFLLALHPALFEKTFIGFAKGTKGVALLTAINWGQIPLSRPRYIRRHPCKLFSFNVVFLVIT
jgi:hypothetical protein